MKTPPLGIAVASIVFATSAVFSNHTFAAQNVVLIMTDDLNDYVVSYGGHPLAQTPNIDRLAKEGMLFRNTYCQFPQCGASRTSIMTGL